MSRLLLRGGHVVDPRNGIDGCHDLLLQAGRIEAIGKTLEPASDTEIVDVSGRLVAPGFVDMHVHLREPGREDEETIASGSVAAAAAGFTGIACMPNTEPINDNRSITEFILETSQRDSPIPVYPIGAVSVGQRGEQLAELGLLAQSGCVAFSDDGLPVATAQLMRRALEYTRMLGIPVIDHCEDTSMTHGAVVHEGSISTKLGLRGWPAAAEEIVVVRDLILAELTGGRLHLAHLSTRGALQRVREAKRGGLQVTCEVMPHHFALTDEAVGRFDTNAKMNPPLRGSSDVDAVLQALGDHTIDVIASDHAPHHADEKLLEFDRAPFGIVGLETSVPLACDRLLHGGVIDASRLVELMSCNPRQILGLEGGHLGVGAPAHLTVLDLEAVKQVDGGRLKSKSQNTPFHGLQLKGWPTMTIVAGEIVWQTES